MSIIKAYFKAKRANQSKMKSGCPYSRAIKQSLNKMFENKASVHFNIAALIAGFSHTSRVRPGSYLLGRSYEFFIVETMLSPHWCTGFFCPPRLEFMDPVVLYHPDIRRRSRLYRKRIFSPFDSAVVRNRAKQFLLNNKFSYHESLSHYPPVFA